MSLNYNIATISNFEDRCYNKLDDGKYELTDATNILIFATMIVDMGTITTENAEKFYTRYRMICAARGRDCSVTLQDVRDHAGLSTNVTDRTDAFFAKNAGLCLRDRIEREVAQEAEQAEGGET
jgi:hypothetical protein